MLYQRLTIGICADVTADIDISIDGDAALASGGDWKEARSFRFAFVINKQSINAEYTHFMKLVIFARSVTMLEEILGANDNQDPKTDYCQNVCVLHKYTA